MKNVWRELERVIDGLSSIPDIQAAAVVRRDGLIITHNLPESIDPKIMAAMTAAIIGTSEMTTVQLGQGRFAQVLIESEHGKLLSTGAGDEAFLVALAYRDANLGLVLMAMSNAARKIDDVLKTAREKRE